MRYVLLAGLLLACAAAPATAQEKPRELKIEKVSATFGVICFQDGKRVAVEYFDGPAKIELYGDFVVFSGQRKDAAPQAIVMTLGTICVMEETVTRQ